MSKIHTYRTVQDIVSDWHALEAPIDGVETWKVSQEGITVGQFTLPLGAAIMVEEAGFEVTVVPPSQVNISRAY